MKKILISFLQTGGANALLPLLKKWESDYDMVITARELVCKNLRKLGFEVRNYPEASSEATLGSIAKKWFEEHAPDLLITDTINLARTPDGKLCRQLWGMAAKYGVPSLAYVDCWWGYKERFQLPEETVPPVLPDKIAVVDDLAKDMMLDLGFLNETLVVLGNPRFEMFLNGEDGPKRIRENGLRRELGLTPDRFLILFVSQPLEKCGGTEEEWGFTEKTTLQAFLDVLKNFPPEIKKDVALLIVPHPEERRHELETIVENAGPGIKVLYRNLDPSLELIRASDLVLGMNSILLAEAVILKKPVLSIQLYQKREEVLVTNRIGATTVIRDPKQLFENLLKAVTEASYRKSLLEQQEGFRVVSDAISRWGNQVNQMMLTPRESILTPG